MIDQPLHANSMEPNSAPSDSGSRKSGYVSEEVHMEPKAAPSDSASRKSGDASEVLGSFKGAAGSTAEASHSEQSGASGIPPLICGDCSDVVLSGNVVETESKGPATSSSNGCSQDLVADHESDPSLRAAWSHPPSIAPSTSSIVTIVPATRLVPPGQSKAAPPKPPELSGAQRFDPHYAPHYADGFVPSVAGSADSSASVKGRMDPKMLKIGPPKNRDLLCANKKCDFLIHNDPGRSWCFCCEFCEGRYFGHAWALNKINNHAFQCEAREPDPKARWPRRANAVRTPWASRWEVPDAPSVASAPSEADCSEASSDQQQGPPPPPAPLLVGSEVRLVSLSGDIRHLEGHKATIAPSCERCDPLYHLEFPLDGGEVCGIHEENLAPTKSPYLTSRPAEGCMRLCSFCLLCNAWAGAEHLKAKRHVSRSYTPWKFILQRDIPRQGRLKPVSVRKGAKAIHYKKAPPPPIKEEEQEEVDGSAMENADQASQASNDESEVDENGVPAPPTASYIGGGFVPPPSEPPPTEAQSHAEGSVWTADAFKKYAWGDDAQASSVRRPDPPPAAFAPWADVVLPPESAIWSGVAAPKATAVSAEFARSESSNNSVAASIREFLHLEDTDESEPMPLPPSILTAPQVGHRMEGSHPYGNPFPQPSHMSVETASRAFPKPPPSQLSRPIPQAPSSVAASNGSVAASNDSVAASVVCSVSASDVLRGSAPQPEIPMTRASAPQAEISVTAFSVAASDVLTGSVPHAEVPEARGEPSVANTTPFSVAASEVFTGSVPHSGVPLARGESCVKSNTSFSVAASDVLTGCIPQEEVPADTGEFSSENIRRVPVEQNASDIESHAAGYATEVDTVPAVDSGTSRKSKSNKIGR